MTCHTAHLARHAVACTSLANSVFSMAVVLTRMLYAVREAFIAVPKITPFVISKTGFASRLVVCYQLIKMHYVTNASH